jgi:PLP dependent protein
VHPGRAAFRFVDKDKAAGVGNAPKRPLQPGTRAGLQAVAQQQQPAAGRQPARRFGQQFARRQVDDQPSAGCLASAHAAPYSAAMGKAGGNRLEEVRAAVAAAARLARPDPADVRLVAVSKGRRAEEIEPLLEAGHRLFGESRVQEASAKWPALIARYPDVELHCIGRLQSNKAAEAVQLFSAIHSLDRRSLLEAIEGEAAKANRFPAVFVQVNIGEEAQKGGCAINELGELLAAVRRSRLPLAGLMAIPPLGPEPSPFFALLAELARRHDVTGLSMGMSGDFAEAVMLGATVVRVGSALFD